jgi:serine/threonine-protein kinase
VHRDVKPGNLLVGADAVVKLADFGIARAADQSSITQVGSVLGTAAYLAPEQARGEEAGPAADLYALAVVTYQLLSGRLPYEAASLSELALRQQRESPAPLDAVNPDVPPALAHAVARGLALDAAVRFEGALAMGEALRAAERGIEPPAPPVPDAATHATELLPHERAEDTEATRMLAREPATRIREPVAPPHPATRRRAPPARPARRRGARAARFLVALLVLAALVAGGAIVAADQLGGKPQLRRVVTRDAQQALDEVHKFIENNTQ